ncbi:hypothetical protein CACET_c14740 [Clostridium aceticum]|uniref:DUF6487 domain-containing protein n=2 Tax=Clostridium TaxID=1485 RepID=A0A0G3WAL5_9CLOT|nr:PF20097 family protein [Clostridium aceticum]AKL94935.1 hypothetical protein CACET_c14740 [Clostridium aceticum]
MRKVDNVSCPKCGQKMKNGYIYSPHQIMWADNNNTKITAIGDETLVGLSGFKMKK